MVMSPNELEALNLIVNPDDGEDDQHVYGSALTPSTVMGREKKEIAKPNVQVEVKTYNRAAHGGAPEAELRA